MAAENTTAKHLRCARILRVISAVTTIAPAVVFALVILAASLNSINVTLR